MNMLGITAILGFVLLSVTHVFADDHMHIAVSKPPMHSVVNGSMFVVMEKGDTTLTLARKYLSRTPYMATTEFERAIRSANHLSEKDKPKPGEKIIIPSIESQPVIEHPRGDAKDSEIRAIYFTGASAGSLSGLHKLERWHELGGNSVVFDIKDSDGSLSISFDHPLAPKTRHPRISNLPKYIRHVHSLGMHAIARIALFRDEFLVTHHNELAVQSRAGKGPWRENGKLVWTDPSNLTVQDYNIALAKFVAQSGVDEVQFDYVRFPAEGDQHDAVFHFLQPDTNGKIPQHERKDVISNFLARAYSEIHPMGVLLSIDVFGVMAWQRHVDLASTGQDIPAMAQHCDIMSPMIYPSHFFGMDGYDRPGDAPEHFISISMERFRKVTMGSGVVLRPWLQAFGWKTRTYSADYIKIQVATARDTGGIGFLFWNAGNDYTVPNKAMPQMMAEQNRYFGRVTVKEQNSSKPTNPKSGNLVRATSAVHAKAEDQVPR